MLKNYPDNQRYIITYRVTTRNSREATSVCLCEPFCLHASTVKWSLVPRNFTGKLRSDQQTLPHGNYLLQPQTLRRISADPSNTVKNLHRYRVMKTSTLRAGTSF